MEMTKLDNPAATYSRNLCGLSKPPLLTIMTFMPLPEA